MLTESLIADAPAAPPLLPSPRPLGRWLPSALVLLLFLTLGFVRYTHDIEDVGDDLAASYVGCRLIASGDAPHHLYSHSTLDFSEVGPDDEWQAAADDGHYESWLHPYVQTPLWAWSLQPLCTHLRFSTFDRLFAALTLLSFAGLIALVAACWAPHLRSPYALAIVLVALWVSIPFQYAMTLMQTHILYVLLTVSALILAERSRSIPAGLLLALAAAVKLTPAIFLVYWLLTRRYRAALTFVLASAALLVVARFTSGPLLFASYLATIHRVSGTLLLSLNNQSLAAAIMTHLYPSTEVAHLFVRPLPRLLQLSSSALCLVSVVLGGLYDRLQTRRNPLRSPPAPLGALFTLVAVTVFTPLAWTHYFIVLLPPLTVLADRALDPASSPRIRRVLALALAIIFALNSRPLATDLPDLLRLQTSPFSLLHAHFVSGFLCLLTLAVTALAHLRSPAEPAPR